MLFPFSPDRVRRDFVSAEQLMQVCDVIWSRDRRARPAVSRRSVPPGSLVYAKCDHYIPLFHQLRRRRARVILLSAESDMAVTTGIARPLQVAEWFSTNAADVSVHSIPLGLENSYSEEVPKAPLLAENASPNESRSRWLYVNFRIETNPSIRRPVWEHFASLQGQTWLTPRPSDAGIPEFVRELGAHRFALCPPGNGIDTHRMWEALYSRTIPVVMRHPALREFEDLPILFVESFSEITLSFLEAAHARISGSQWNWEKLFSPWWRRRLTDARDTLRKSGPCIGRARFAGRLISSVLRNLLRQGEPERLRTPA